MITEKDLTVEQRMAISLAIDFMCRNIRRYSNTSMICQDKRVSFGEAINILADIVTIKDTK